MLGIGRRGVTCIGSGILSWMAAFGPAEAATLFGYAGAGPNADTLYTIDTGTAPTPVGTETVVDMTISEIEYGGSVVYAASVGGNSDLQVIDPATGQVTRSIVLKAAGCVGLLGRSRR